MKISLSPGISLSHPDSLDFQRALRVGEEDDFADLLVANTSASGNVAISSIAISPGDFTETDGCPATLAASDSCVLHVTFAPTARGNRTGTITITDTAPGSPHLINLMGTGLAPVVNLSNTSLTFVPQALTTFSADQQLSLTNSGDANLVISAMHLTGDFEESTTCVTQAPASSCQISIQGKELALVSG